MGAVDLVMEPLLHRAPRNGCMARRPANRQPPVTTGEIALIAGVLLGEGPFPPSGLEARPWGGVGFGPYAVAILASVLGEVRAVRTGVAAAAPGVDVQMTHIGGATSIWSASLTALVESRRETIAATLIHAACAAACSAVSSAAH